MFKLSRCYNYFAVIVLCCAFVFTAGCQNDSAPKNAFMAFNEALNNKNWETVWKMLSSNSQKAFAEEGYKRMHEIIEAMPPEMRKKKPESLGVTYNELLDMSPEKFFLYVMKKTEKSQDFFNVPMNPEISKVKIKDNKAVLFIKGKNEYVNMVLENNEWKIEFEEETKQ